MCFPETGPLPVAQATAEASYPSFHAGMQASACGIRLPSLSFARGSPVRYARARCSPLKPTCAGPFKSSLPPHRSNTRKLGCSTVSCPWHTALNRRPLEPCTERFAVHLNGAEDFSARRADGKEDDDVRAPTSLMDSCVIASQGFVAATPQSFRLVHQ